MRGRGELDALCDLTGRGRGPTEGGVLGMGTSPGLGLWTSYPAITSCLLLHGTCVQAPGVPCSDVVSRPLVSPALIWRPGPLCPLQ